MNYTVRLGDTLGTIAAKFLGSSARFTEILKANPQITNPNVISVGTVLKIPTSSSTSSVASRSPQSVATKAGALLQNPRNLMLIGVAMIGAYYFFGKSMYKRMGKT